MLFGSFGIFIKVSVISTYFDIKSGAVRHRTGNYGMASGQQHGAYDPGE